MVPAVKLKTEGFTSTCFAERRSCYFTRVMLITLQQRCADVSVLFVSVKIYPFRILSVSSREITIRICLLLQCMHDFLLVRMYAYIPFSLAGMSGHYRNQYYTTSYQLENLR